MPAWRNFGRYKATSKNGISIEPPERGQAPPPFHVGERVVCVNNHVYDGYSADLAIGDTYIVRTASLFADAITVNRLDGTRLGANYRHTRFVRAT